MPHSRSRQAAALTLLAVLSAVASISAHRRDEYLQAARVTIDPARVRIELDLTPGMSVADNVLQQVDADHNGAITRAEGQAYVAGVVGAIQLDVDGRPLAVQTIDSTFPTVEAVRNGEGTIRIAMTAAMPGLTAGVHHVTYRNTHRRDVGVYLANALVPANDRITVAAQQRDAAQHDLTIEYVLRADPATVENRWSLLAIAGGLLVAALLSRRLLQRAAPAESA